LTLIVGEQTGSEHIMIASKYEDVSEIREEVNSDQSTNESLLLWEQ